jgi:hypothetical protein
MDKVWWRMCDELCLKDEHCLQVCIDMAEAQKTLAVECSEYVGEKCTVCGQEIFLIKEG